MTQLVNDYVFVITRDKRCEHDQHFFDFLLLLFKLLPTSVVHIKKIVSTLRRTKFTNSEGCMKSIFIFLTALVLIATTTGCASLRGRIEPEGVFDDSSGLAKAKAPSILKYEQCSSTLGPDVQRGTNLPAAYVRFATAAYCAYFTDLDAYRRPGLITDSAQQGQTKLLSATSGAAPQNPQTDKTTASAVTPAGAAPTPSPAPQAAATTTGGKPATTSPGVASENPSPTTGALGPPTEMTPIHRQWLHAYLETGLELSRANCSAFFNHRERDRVETTFWLGAANTVLSGITAALTNAGDRARSAFNIATLLTGSNAIGAQYQSSFLLTAELGRLHERLEQDVFSPYRSAMRSDFRDKKYSSFSQITQDIQRYEDLCSHKSLVRALAKATDLVSFSPADGDVPPQNRIDADSMLNEFSTDKEVVKQIRDEISRFVALSDLELVKRKLLIEKRGEPSMSAVAPILATADTLELDKDDQSFVKNSRKLRAIAMLLRQDRQATLDAQAYRWEKIYTALAEAGKKSAGDVEKKNLKRTAEASVKLLEPEGVRDNSLSERRFGIQVQAK